MDLHNSFRLPKNFRLLAWVFMGTVFCEAYAQTPTEYDYRRAQSFVRDSLWNHTYHRQVRPNWLKDHSGFTYKAHTREGEKFYYVSFPKKSKRPAFNRKRLADSLQNYLEEKIDFKDLPLREITWFNPDSLQFKSHGNTYGVNLQRYSIRPLHNDTPRLSAKESLSPNKDFKISLKDHNLSLTHIKTQRKTALTQDGEDYYVYGSTYGWAQTMKGEGTPPEPNFNVQWSPDSKKVLTQIMDARKGEKMYLLDWSVDSLYRPQLLSYYRASPGDTNDVKYTYVIFDTATDKMTSVDLPPLPHYLELNLRWSKDSRHVYGLYYHRGFKQVDIIEIDVQTGKLRTVFSDRSKTNVEYNTQFRFIENKDLAFITSERSGWKQFYRVDWKSGSVQALTQGKFVVQEIKAVDPENQVLYFTASGKKGGVDPYYSFLYRVDFDGNNLKLLTHEPVNHEVHISPDFKYFIDNQSTTNQPTTSYLRQTTHGKTLMKIDQTDIQDLTERGWHPPEIFKATARDEKTAIYGALWKPTKFDSTKTYPIIDYTYTGPHTYTVPHNFINVIWPYAYADIQALAELGFVVVNIDGLGSAGRSKSFHNWSYKKLGDNLKDHVLAIKQLKESHPYIDTTRVGIFGHSAGGYDAAHALLTFNDFYKVAISESGDQDWRMEKAWWPEMYAGWPIEPQYEEQSNVTLAPNLKGDLLLIHGGIDANVNPSATFKLAENLLKSGKYFDMLIIPSGHHSYPKEYVPYVMKKRWHYFVDHLKRSSKQE